MKNIIGAITATVMATTFMYLMHNLSITQYTNLPALLAFALSMGSTLVGAGQGTTIIVSIRAFLPIWLLSGLVLGPFSNPGWNTIRSSIWFGVILAILTIFSMLYVAPSFWYLPERNLQLFLIFASSIILAQVTLVSAIPLALFLDRIKIRNELPIPEKIETVCTCGAIYKSKPLICSACSRPLNVTPLPETTGHA